VYNNTLATLKHQMQQAENPTPGVAISVEPARVDNTIRLDYLTSKVALKKPEIGSTDPNIRKDNHCTDDEVHFGMPQGSEDFAVEDEQSDAITTASCRQRAATKLERFDLGTSDVDG
jgi:hypothetical protein